MNCVAAMGLTCVDNSYYRKFVVKSTYCDVLVAGSVIRESVPDVGHAVFEAALGKTSSSLRTVEVEQVTAGRTHSYVLCYILIVKSENSSCTCPKSDC